MKILIVSGAFMPENSPRSFRTTELAKQLARLGHVVDIYVPKYNYDYSTFNKEFPSINLHFIDIKYRLIKIEGNFIKRLFLRLVNRVTDVYLQYPDIKFLNILPKLLAHKGGYDSLISIAVPHPIHWGMARVFKKNPEIAKIWIADCGDPFMLSKTINVRYPFYFKYFEKSWCRRCNYITIPTENAVDGYYPEFRNKIRIIPQGFDFEDTQASEIKYEANKVITFCYAGGFIPNRRDLRPILDFLSKQNINFKFHVYTRQQAMLSNYVQLLKGKLEIHNYIPRKELFVKLCKSDFLLNLENGTSVQSPSKLIDYALSERPILSLNSQNIDNEKFVEFLNGDYTKRLVVDDISKFDIRNVTNKFIELMK